MFGRDVGSVFQARAPNKKDAADGSAGNAEGQKDAAFASKRFISESEVRHCWDLMLRLDCPIASFGSITHYFPAPSDKILQGGNS